MSKGVNCKISIYLKSQSPGFPKLDDFWVSVPCIPCFADYFKNGITQMLVVPVDSVPKALSPLSKPEWRVKASIFAQYTLRQ